MENKVNIQQNRIYLLEDSMVMYGIYNSDTLEKLIDTVQKCITKQPGMKNYLPVNLIIGLYPRKKLAVIL